MLKHFICHRCGFTPDPGVTARHCPRDGLRLVPIEEHEKNPHDPYLGRSLGGDRYALVGLLGEGAMGAVYLARQVPLEREVAVKVIRPMAGGNAKARELLVQRFSREAQLQADFNHHAVVTLLDFGAEPDGTLFMVMERLQGRVLTDVLPGMDPRILTGIVLQLLDALVRFHDQDLIHRDIKPDNVMVLDGPPFQEDIPRIKLIDFGIAKSLRDQSNVKLTQDGTVFGTPEYMAPEQAIGVPGAVDHRADLYAVGAVLYEGLSGQAPFLASTPLAVLHRVVNAKPAPLPETVPEALRDVVFKALAKAKDDRFQSAMEFSRALAQAMGVGRERFPRVDTGRSSAGASGERVPDAEGGDAVVTRRGSGPSPAPRSGSGPSPAPNAASAPAPGPRTGSGPKPAVESSPRAPAPAASRAESTLTPLASAAAVVAPERLGPMETTLPGSVGETNDPRDAFVIHPAVDLEPSSPGVDGVRRPSRAAWIGIATVAALAGGIAWFVSRPPEPPRPVVSQEPVRVTVRANIGGPDVPPSGPSASSAPPPRAPPPP
ncbi:MAG: serine/threonine-protein kinase [Bradymonadia bacterium]